MSQTPTAAPRARLLVQVTEAGRPRSFDWSLPTTPGAEMTVGRSRSTDLTLRDEHVSGRHLRIVATPEGHALVDLGATNGTTLNGQAFPPHTPQPLQPDDRIVLGGSAEMVYQIDPSTAPPPSTLASAPTPPTPEHAEPSESSPPQSSNSEVIPVEDEPSDSIDENTSGTSLGLLVLIGVIGLAILGVIGYFAWVLLGSPTG